MVDFTFVHNCRSSKDELTENLMLIHHGTRSSLKHRGVSCHSSMRRGASPINNKDGLEAAVAAQGLRPDLCPVAFWSGIHPARYHCEDTTGWRLHSELARNGQSSLSTDACCPSLRSLTHHRSVLRPLKVIGRDIPSLHLAMRSHS